MGTQLFYYSISTAILILFGFVLVLLASSAFAIMSASTSAGHNVWDEDWEQQADVGPVLCPYRFLKIYIYPYQRRRVLTGIDLRRAAHAGEESLIQSHQSTAQSAAGRI